MEETKAPDGIDSKACFEKHGETARPVVAADAGGAVVGAMAGAVTGPGIVATGMAGACGSSAGYCVGGLINGN